jgi:hypothetical protein
VEVKLCEFCTLELDADGQSVSVTLRWAGMLWASRSVRVASREGTCNYAPLRKLTPFVSGLKSVALPSL